MVLSFRLLAFVDCDAGVFISGYSCGFILGLLFWNTFVMVG